MTVIRTLTEADLPEAQRIVRLAFGTFLRAPAPERFWSDLDYVYGRFGAAHTAAFAAENDEGGLGGPLSKPTAAAQLWPRQLPFVPHTCRS